MKSAYDIRIRVNAGRNGRPRSGDGVRVLINRCRVKPETKAQLDAWLADLREIKPETNEGALLDWVVELAQRRGAKIAGK